MTTKFSAYDKITNQIIEAIVSLSSPHEEAIKAATEALEQVK